jgi:gluconate 5-dehydrogenase
MTPKSSLFDLTGRTALVTGSSQGIGLALARGLAEAGAAVVLNGRDAAKLYAAAEGLRVVVPGARVTTAAFDVTRSAEIETAVARIEADFAPIDVLLITPGFIGARRSRKCPRRSGARSSTRISRAPFSSRGRWRRG